MPDDPLTRAELLRRAGLGAAGVAVSGSGAYALSRLLQDDAAARLVATPGARTIHRFISRPDLKRPWSP